MRKISKTGRAPRLIEIRKLAAVDMVWLGAGVVIAEYALGVILPLALGTLSIRAGIAERPLMNWQTLLGIWLVTISVNYVPLFVYAVTIARARRVRDEGLAEIANARRYGIQQVMILVPMLVVAVALAQEWVRQRR
jgi:hypothetical protein